MADELSLFAGVLDGPGSSQLGRLLEGMLTAQVTSALARLGVPDQLADGPSAAGQLAPRVGAAADALDRLLTAAAAYGLVSRDTAGRYSLTQPVNCSARMRLARRGPWRPASSARRCGAPSGG